MQRPASRKRLRLHDQDGNGYSALGQVRLGRGQFIPYKVVPFRATITAVYDGETCTAAVDLGFKVTMRGEKIRLSRINALEIRGANRKAGLASRDFLRELILGREVLLQTIRDKRGKYGRYLGEIVVKQGRSNVNANDALV